jgi:quercetin dioxygenase-like cupin family protein
MQLQPKRPSVKGAPERFAGEVWFDVILDDQVSSRLRAAFVHFGPGARNAWHAHTLGQTLHVIEGIGRTQARGGEVVEIRAGDTIHTSPGEWHWHGAAPDHLMSHLTVYEAPDDGVDTEWGSHVTDEEYAGAS